MSGYDVSSSERYSGSFEIWIDLNNDLNHDAIKLVERRIHDFLKAITVGFFFPGTARSPAINAVDIKASSLQCHYEVVDLAKTAFAVLGGLLSDCFHHEVSFRSANVILGGERINLLVETGLRPDAVDHPSFKIEFPEDMSGNYALLVEIEFGNSVETDFGQLLLDELALWEVLSLAYPSDPDEPVQVCGAQIHFNDPRTIHHHEWVWDNADFSAWNLLVNLCCAWNKKLPVVRLHIE